MLHGGRCCGCKYRAAPGRRPSRRSIGTTCTTALRLTTSRAPQPVAVVHTFANCSVAARPVGHDGETAAQHRVAEVHAERRAGQGPGPSAALSLVNALILACGLGAAERAVWESVYRDLSEIRPNKNDFINDDVASDDVIDAEIVE